MAHVGAASHAERHSLAVVGTDNVLGWGGVRVKVRVRVRVSVRVKGDW